MTWSAWVPALAGNDPKANCTAAKTINFQGAQGGGANQLSFAIAHSHLAADYRAATLLGTILSYVKKFPKSPVDFGTSKGVCQELRKGPCF